MKNVFKSLVCAAALVLFATSAFANDYVKFKGWKQAETTHFRFIYEAASEEAAKKYAEIADEAWEKIARIYSMPQEKTNVYVFSRMNIVNAYTYFAPPEIIMYDSPVLDSYFGFRDDWMKLFFTHELIHIANITFEDKEYLSAKLFGEALRGMDYSSIPGWALEGLTTVLETELTNGGRGRSPYFELDYKAATLDNNFIPYRLIGTEQEPPYSQIYVMGYLIMRSIADRWGIQALADIERNRDIDHTWEESVELVTGHTPQDIYREVKISLEKRYAKERTIPEGKIISPNDINQHYYTPAIIFDDGSFITVTNSGYSGLTAVLYNPNAQKDCKQKELFSAYFDAYTADENKTVYYTSSVSRYDRNPGNETQFPIYKWTDADGSKLLTKDTSSYYQLTVSRDGKVLVAVEQSGLKMRLVQIDTETGDKTILFEDSRYSFVQPALNADGSQLAFLLLKDDRACVALADMAAKQYKIVNNTDYDFITDPANPSFNKDGTLNFCSNDRGRLEIFEAKLNSDGQTFTYTPVVADPIGALWAYKNDVGIFYTSHASTGNVIKIKPVEEWGKVPDFEGPSPAGQIMTFGGLEDDYPDFKPFEKTAEATEEEESEEDTKKEPEEKGLKALTKKLDKDNKKDDDSDYKRRSQEKIDELNELEPATKELTKQRIYIPTIQPYLYSPFINILDDDENLYLGVGGFFLGMLPKLQMRSGMVWFDAFYYPTLKNFTGEFMTEFPVGTGAIDILVSRNKYNLSEEKGGFAMNNLAMLGYTQPIIDREKVDKSIALKALTYAGFSMNQKSDKAFSIDADIPFTKELSFHAGLDYSQRYTESDDFTTSFSIVNLALGHYDFEANKVQVGFEGEYSMKNIFDSFSQETALVVRYTDFASETVPTFSRAHFNGFYENCLYPGKVVISYAYILPDVLGGLGNLNVNVQSMASFGQNSDGKTPVTGLPLNIKIEPKFNLGAEVSIPFGLEQKLAFGYTAMFELGDGKFQEPKTKFYLSCKINWLRL